jgi:1-acyl-sn-glycerol-3-phosphate acyltransferase
MKPIKVLYLPILALCTIVIYHCVIALMRIALFCFARWTVIGTENIPKHDGCVLVSNHIHIVDPPLVAASSRSRRLRTMAKQELFDLPLVGWVFKAYGAYAVKRSGTGLKAMRDSLRLLDRGEAILLFAEGTRSRGGPLRPAQRGAALIALRSKLPVIPVSIQGSNVRFPGIFFAWILRQRPEITVEFGKPVDLGHIDINVVGAAEATDRIMREIALGLPSEQRGPYAGARDPIAPPVVAKDRLN